MYYLENFFKALLLLLILSIIITTIVLGWIEIGIMSDRIENVLIPDLRQNIERYFFPSSEN